MDRANASALCDYPPRRIGVEQEQLAAGDTVSGSAAAKPASDKRGRYGRPDGNAHRCPRSLGQGERRVTVDYALL